jgi:hypothetical protein
MTTTNKETLEAIVDSMGLELTVHALGQICADKAEHIAVNWQDTNTAKPWAKAGALIDVLAIKIKGLGV